MEIILLCCPNITTDNKKLLYYTNAEAYEILLSIVKHIFFSPNPCTGNEKE